MKANHSLPSPLPEKPYEHDKFSRAEHGYVLSKIINLQEGGMVVGLNGSWGIGKTTFLEMWQQQLLLDGHQVAYFNAWSDDYSTDPLPALLATFKDLSKADGKDEIWSEVLKAGSAFAKNTLPTLLGFLLEKHTGIKNINDLGIAFSEGSVEYLTEEVSEFSKRKRFLQQLRVKLAEYVNRANTMKKAVVIIDELDRCRPHYAVSVLELIKHLFSIKDVAFVLAIDKEQLKHAICGVYGSSQMDANAYLQRFVNIEYNLPAPDSDAIARYFTNYFIIERDGNTVGNEGVKRINWDPTSFIEFVTLFQEDKQLSIRNLEKIFVTTRLALDALNYNPKPIFEIVFFLAYLLHHHPEVHTETLTNSLSTEEFANRIQELLPSAESESPTTMDMLTFIEALMVMAYNSGTTKKNRIELLSDDPYKELSTTRGRLRSKYDNEPIEMRINIKGILNNRKDFNSIKLTRLIKAVRQFKGLAGN